MAGRNALYKHVSGIVPPRVKRVRLVRSFHCTPSSSNNSDPSLDPDFQIPPPNPHAKDVAILGGGISGLATAWNLSRQLPNAKITIFEKSQRLGGCVNSEVIPVDDGEIVFEWGPRTLRSGLRNAAALSMIDMVRSHFPPLPDVANVYETKIWELDLIDEVVAISKTSPASTNRYLYYPDHLVRMPGPPTGSVLSELLRTAYSLATEPLYDGFLKGLTREPWVPLRDPTVQDESLGAFLSRRFGPNITDNIASALGHGIFAGDIYQLSARTLQPLRWHLETRDREHEGGILLEHISLLINRYKIIPLKTVRFEQRRRREEQLVDNSQLQQRILDFSMFQQASVYTFRRGLGQLIASLEMNLRRNPNITIQESTDVQEVTFQKNTKRVSISSNSSTGVKTSTYDYAVSSLGPSAMKDFLISTSKAQGLTPDPHAITACEHSNASVNVMVVNLYYSNPELIDPSISGFGYLLPRSVPLEQNPERALGVIFSSESSGRPGSMVRKPFRIHKLLQQAQQSAVNDGKDESEMEPPEMDNPQLQEALAEWQKKEPEGQDTASGTKLTVMMGGHWWNGWASSDLPSEEEAIEMAQNLLRRHLGIEEAPKIAKARLNPECIPQYPVGYPQDMASIHQALQTLYQGRFKVAGPWWQGSPSVNDCVLRARTTAWAIRDQQDSVTGLEDFGKEQWLVRHDDSDVTSVESTR